MVALCERAGLKRNWYFLSTSRALRPEHLPPPPSLSNASFLSYRTLAARDESRTEPFGADSARMRERAKRRILGVFKRARTQQTGHNPSERRRGDFHHGLLDRIHAFLPLKGPRHRQPQPESYPRRHLGAQTRRARVSARTQPRRCWPARRRRSRPPGYPMSRIPRRRSLRRCGCCHRQRPR